MSAAPPPITHQRWESHTVCSRNRTTLPAGSLRSSPRTTIRVGLPGLGALGRGASPPASGAADTRTASVRALAPTASSPRPNDREALLRTTENHLSNVALASSRVLLGAEVSKRRVRR